MSFKDYENSVSGESVNFGGDIKLAIDNSLTLDLTLNPDFSQVEVDQQVLILQGMKLHYPKKDSSLLRIVICFLVLETQKMLTHFFREE